MKRQESKISRKSKAFKSSGSKEQPSSASSKTRKASSAKIAMRPSSDDLAAEASRRFAKDRSKMSAKKPRLEGKSGPSNETTKKRRGKKKSDAFLGKKSTGEASAGIGATARPATSKTNVSSKPTSPLPKGDGAKRDIGSEEKGSKPNADVTASAKDAKLKGDAGVSSDKGGEDKVKARKKSHHVHVRRKSMVIAAMSKMIGKRHNRPGKKQDSASEESLSSKEQLSLFVVAVLAAFFFCFLVILLFYYFFTGPNIPVAVACVSDECQEAREFLDGLLNDAKKPCADFYGHVCDSWRDKDSSFHGDVARTALIRFNASLFGMLKVKHEDDLRHGIHVVRPVYRSCYRYMSVPVDLKDAMNETHELLDIGKLLKAPSFFDVVRYLVRQSMQIGLNTLFNAIFVYEMGRNMLFMRRGLSLRDKLHKPFDSGEERRYFEITLQRLASRGLRSASFYLATNAVSGVAGMMSRRDDIAKSEVTKAHFCLQFTHKCLTLTWAYLASRYASTPRSVSVLQGMLAAIQGVVTEQPDTFTWMEKVSREKTADVLYRTTLRVIAGSGFNVSRIEYPKDQLPFAEDESFLRVLVAALRLQYTVMSASPPTRLEMLISDLEFGATLKYVPEKQYIVLPTLYQRPPYVYSFGVPDYFNYGTMGALISQKLAEAAGIGVANPRQAVWDRITRSQYADTLACLVDQRKRMGFGEPGKEVTAEQKAQLLALSISVRLAYLGLTKIFRIRSGTVKVFNDYWPEAQRVFFARYCLLWCSGGASDGGPLTPREKCMLPLRNMQEFADLYHCELNTTHSGGDPLCKI